MRAVVDTNVILAANSKHPALSEECEEACIDLLLGLSRAGCTLIDSEGLLVDEYLRKTTPWTGNRAGDVFLKWLINNQGNPRRVRVVSLTPTAGSSFAEFDALGLTAAVDPSDRKFVAVAAQGGGVVLEASDCKWLDWWIELDGVGVRVKFPCPSDIKKFYRRKFPGKPVPRTTHAPP